MQERLEYGELASCEEEFANLDTVSLVIEGLSKQLLAEVAKLRRASLDGNLSAVVRTRSAVEKHLAEISTEFTRVIAFRDQAILAALGSRRFLQEIVLCASKIGYDEIRLVGNSVLAFPNRLTVDDKGVKIGKRASPIVRPKSLVNALKAEKAVALQPGFIDAVKRAYDERSGGSALSVPLSEIYELLTLLPDTRKAYSEVDFIREISILDAVGPHLARDGSRVSFPASTSARMSKGYKAVSPSGEDVTYASIRFDGAR